MKQNDVPGICGIDTRKLTKKIRQKGTILGKITYKDEKINFVINIPKNIEKEKLDNDYLIRRKKIDFDIPLITNLQLAKRFVKAIQRTKLDYLKIKSWDEYI